MVLAALHHELDWAEMILFWKVCVWVGDHRSRITDGKTWVSSSQLSVIRLHFSQPARHHLWVAADQSRHHVK